MDKQRTTKGQQTSQHILETAITLFSEQGYEKTTMREIATAADRALGLTYRYFPRKEELIHAWYLELANETILQMQVLEGDSIANRFYRAMDDKLKQITPYRALLNSLFGAAMNPQSGIAILGSEASEVQHRMREAFLELVLNSKDCPKEPRATQVATILYMVQLLLIMAWLYDRTPGYRATYQALDLARDGLRMLRPLLMLPLTANMLAKLAGILEAIIEGEQS